MSVRVPPAELVTPELVRFYFTLLRVPVTGIVTSWWRSPADNARVGGAPRSLHLSGLAIDVVPHDWIAAEQAFRRAGLRVLNEGDHLHVSV